MAGSPFGWTHWVACNKISPSGRIIEFLGLGGTSRIIEFQAPRPWARTPYTRSGCSLLQLIRMKTHKQKDQPLLYSTHIHYGSLQLLIRISSQPLSHNWPWIFLCQLPNADINTCRQMSWLVPRPPVVAFDLLLPPISQNHFGC